jgi:hypothetical protein
VVEVLDRVDAIGLWYCVEGGRGVDPLLGEQTHRSAGTGTRHSTTSIGQT